MEIRRFGYGHRRPEGPRGTTGVQAAVIHSDARASVSELALARNAVIEPHTNPNTTWFVVIEGGGFVQVGDQQARVFAGEAVLWPAGIPHGASTELSEMRAIVIELAGADDAAVRGIIEGRALALTAGGDSAGAGGGPADKAAERPVSKGEGRLADAGPAKRYDPTEGEPE